MQTVYKRIPLNGILFLISAIIMLFAGILNLITENPIGIAFIIASILNLVGGLWFLNTPFLTINGDTLLFKEALLRKQSFQINEVQEVEALKRKMVFSMKNGSKKFIRIDQISKDNRVILKQTLDSMITTPNN